MKLENWSITKSKRDQWKAPELCEPRLHGVVTGHPRHDDGTEVTTSAIAGVEGNCVKTTSGSLYELGEIDPQYEARFPGSLKRLLESYGSK